MYYQLHCGIHLINIMYANFVYTSKIDINNMYVIIF